MSFDRLPPGVSPDDCEPDSYEPEPDPDRIYEQKLERDHDAERGEL